ncbi:MAG TPA: coproporphyrinogen dehydrogenase HemZ [Clostridiales bacterium]|nr:coproporphyrinogen dehydrogenase HemZ [Clostridiales bacterium]
MIDIVLSDKAYENDFYPLVKAFYPEETVKVYSMEEFAGHQKDRHKTYGTWEKSLPEKGFLLPGQEKTEGQPDRGMRIEVELQREFFLIRIIGINKVVRQDEDKEGSAASREKRVPCLSEALTKAQYKNTLKRALYQLLSQEVKRELPWGILTGIRPTKLVYELLEQGTPEDGIKARMHEEYLCSGEKVDMSIQIARRELQLLSEMDYRKGYSLYIGIPFCPTTCLYCSFTSYSIAKFAGLVEDYLVALEKELEYAATCFPDKKLTTVYLGGGTPTTLAAGQLDRLLGRVRQLFDFSNVKEFCVEAGRPDSITPEKLQVLKKWGVSRISINPQSMQQGTLDLIGRQHSVEEVKEAFHMAREAGHNNINMDIIIGLPGERPEDVADTLRQIRELEPESLTVHTLAIKRAARLNLERDNYARLKASEVPRMLEETVRFAKENSYLPYYLYRQKNMADNLENIGYSRYGKEGLYNILIMEEKQTILALGAGGMSKFVFHKENRLERVDNVKSVTDYINRIDEMIGRKRDFIARNDI